MILYAVGRHFSRLCFEEGVTVYADLIRFLVRMRGALTPPPRMDEPVTKMPLGWRQTDEDELNRLNRALWLYVIHAPSCSEDTESYAETYTRRCPQVWTRLFKEPANVERLSRACAAHKVKYQVKSTTRSVFKKEGLVRTCEEKIEGNCYREKSREP